MPDVAPVPVVRPNGKTYRPRYVGIEPWEDDTVHGWRGGVYVLGTHDVEGTRQMATDMIKSHFDGDMVATAPERCWVRLGYQNGEAWWITDEVRGRAAVQWTADYPD